MALETFEREARLKSPISAKIKELAVELAEAKGKTAQDAVKEKAKAEIIAEIEAIQSGKPKSEPAPVETPPAEPETPKAVVNAVEELPAEGRIVKDIPAESVFADSNRRYLDVPYKSKDTAKELGAHWDPKKKQWFTFGDDQAARVKSVLDGSAYKFAMENANDEQRERLKNYAKNFGENSKMVSMVADEIENQMKKADKAAPEGGVPGAQQLLFDVGRKTDAPGQSLMFEDEDQRPREAPPLVSGANLSNDWNSMPSLGGRDMLLLKAGIKGSSPDTPWNNLSKPTREKLQAVYSESKGVENINSRRIQEASDKVSQRLDEYENALKNTPHTAHLAEKRLEEAIELQNTYERIFGQSKKYESIQDQFPDDWMGDQSKTRVAAKLLIDNGVLSKAEASKAWGDHDRLISAVISSIESDKDKKIQQRKDREKQATRKSIDDMLANLGD
jgi:hypothetical protein